ncbi:ribbon-helix-helix protein, CopG family [Halovenus sp. WSH3]|uniref:Ribbon-helix-helix protein, CopG family n=1 Tax=Halovenus carboxidivorans TaxID=2692199 RepID=A0A6B0T9S2_9EURY|nr:ribbon-helix-helix protein, CopG family [Halovenus carboxidivorans]MXR51620.1 ribbon-helix-helix protein, CopG family [Halovenus carboxidivorans]
MDELTLRLPAETTAALRSEADERGVTVEEHLRDIIDAYHADEQRRPARAVEYVHAVGTEATALSDGEPDNSEEIGSFRYGSRSVLSQ